YGKDNKFLEFKILKNTSKYFLKDLNDVLDNEILGNLKYRIIAYKSFLRILNKETANKVDILRKEGTTINYTNECESYEKLMFLCEKYYTTFYDIEKEIEKIDYYDMITLKIHNKIVNAITLFQIFVGKIKENNINCDLTDYLIEGELLGFSSFNIYENISIIKDFFINMKGICNEVINSHDTNKYKFILKEWEIWLKGLIDKIHHLMIIYKENKNIKIYEIYN
ncbi:hypothetical protein, partial [Clostridium tarantellae]|uniref:hypothetical protein n=1 Tax=Clostridium tarantellae TaxID=39493 RepID=UPI0014780D12